jgi:hypothetical protein
LLYFFLLLNLAFAFDASDMYDISKSKKSTRQDVDLVTLFKQRKMLQNAFHGNLEEDFLLAWMVRTPQCWIFISDCLLFRFTVD